MVSKDILTWTLALTLAVVGTFAGIAFATVSFRPDCDDPTSSGEEDAWTCPPCGFAGKGDVQLAFGWNNPTMQSHHAHITFEWVETETKTQECVEKEGPPYPPGLKS